MRRAIRPNPGRVQTAVARSLPAPVGGWDTESPIAAMSVKNALILDNWIPRASSCELRRGFISHVSGTPEEVETFIVYRGDPDGDVLLACSGTDIYDVTEAGSLGSAIYASAASAHWRSTNFANDAGAFAIAVNGLNTPIRYDGTSITNLSITGSSGPITLDPSKLFDVAVFKRRLWFLEENTLRSWFLQTNAIQGDAQLLDQGPLFSKGGHLWAVANWSLDGGQGIDDALVFITTEGQVSVWQGIDPTDADNWSLVGVYDLARPLGHECFLKYGAELAVLTEDGVIPLSQALNKDRVHQKKIALTANIATAFAEASDRYRTNHGWTTVLYPGRGSLVIVNVPVIEHSESHQYVQSVSSGAWCRFTGINAFCWAFANGNIYFGAEEGVFQWDMGSSDNGEMISGDMKPAFSAFGNRAAQKHFTMARMLMRAPAIVKPALEVLTDYREATPTAVPTVVTPGDLSLDDATAVRDDWTSVTGIGYVGSPRSRVEIRGDDETSQLSIDGVDLLITEGPGDHLLITPNLPFDVHVECLGFDIMFQGGGQL